MNLERSSDSSGLEGGRKFGRAPYVRVSMVSSGRAMRVWYGPLELTDVRENARLEPLVYRQTLFVLNKADWQLRRIEDMVGCMATFYSAWAPQSPEIWRKRVKRAKPHRPSPLRRASQATTPASRLHSHIAVPSFPRSEMLAPRRTNRYSWLFPRAKKNPNMDNEQATFWLNQFIGKNLRIHASDGRVFGGQMKCTDKVGYDVCTSLHCVDTV